MSSIPNMYKSPSIFREDFIGDILFVKILEPYYSRASSHG